VIWFSSDYHIGHENIIGYGNRPFKDAAEMEEVIIQRHNEIVTKDDVTYLVGDTFFEGKFCKDLKVNDRIEKAQQFLRRLNGQKIIMEGNHDERLTRHLGPGQIQIKEVAFDGHKIVACHYPMLSWPGSFHGSTMVHGHTHQTNQLTLPPRKLIHIGVDSWDFRPVSARQIVDLANTLQTNDI